MTQVSRETFDQVMVPNYSPLKIIPVKGEGAKLWDKEGNEYVDFAGQGPNSANVERVIPAAID